MQHLIHIHADDNDLKLATISLHKLEAVRHKIQNER